LKLGSCYCYDDGQLQLTPVATGIASCHGAEPEAGLAIITITVHIHEGMTDEQNEGSHLH